MIAGCVSVEAPRELDHAGFAGREALKDRPAGGVGQGGECPAHGILFDHYQQVI